MSRPLVVAMCMGSLALCACSQQEPESPAAAAAARDSTSAPTSSAGSSSAPPAESSLAIKRGTLSLGADRSTFRLCDTQTDLWVLDQSDGSLRTTFADEPQPLDLYVEAHGERKPLSQQLAQANGYSDAFILEEVLYAAPLGESHGCEQPTPSYIVMARGNEPFWTIEVTAERMVWRQPEEPKEVVC